MSILSVLMLMGVASSMCSGNYGNDDNLQPIVSTSQSRRICAALCMSGLGGKVCGDSCLDIMPEGLPLQSAESSHDTSAVSAARTDACPILCANRLGYPLCNCSEEVAARTTEVDFVRICGYFCIHLNYQIHGCQKCHIYVAAAEENGADQFLSEKNYKSVDWDAWCRLQCSAGEGGIACNCDILPLKAEITA